MISKFFSFALTSSVFWFLIGFWIEKHFSDSWGEIYYRWGIPLYRERYKRGKVQNGDANRKTRVLEIRQIDQETAFFRLGKFDHGHCGRYMEWSPVRGNVVKDPITGVCRITFLLNWHVAPFLIFMAGGILSTGTDSGKLGAIGVVLYVIWLVYRAHSLVVRHC